MNRRRFLGRLLGGLAAAVAAPVVVKVTPLATATGTAAMADAFGYHVGNQSGTWGGITRDSYPTLNACVDYAHPGNVLTPAHFDRMVAVMSRRQAEAYSALL